MTNIPLMVQTVSRLHYIFFDRELARIELYFRGYSFAVLDKKVAVWPLETLAVLGFEMLPFRYRACFVLIATMTLCM